jgi:hypothetical protein
MKMVYGARALAAALAGAKLYIEVGDKMLEASPDAARRFERHFAAGSPGANVYAVRAADASSVLGRDTKGREVH